MLVGPEDVLDVNVWKEPDMTRSVSPAGRKISLPLINDVQAAGSTPQQLAANVTEKLRKFLTETSVVTVIVTAITNSQRVRLWSVKCFATEGDFPPILGMTVWQALAEIRGILRPLPM